MGLGALHQHRRFAGALALVGMVFYAVIVPWHTVSQATTPSLDLANSFEPPCHHASTRENAKSSQPLKPQTNCPICKGFAALHLATDVPINMLLVGVRASALLPRAGEDGLAKATARAPQNRGPPAFSI
jgi:hypothetical protein